MALDVLGAGGIIERDVALGPLTTYRFGGSARYFAEVTDTASLLDVLGATNREGLPLLVLGRGSNVVVSASGYPGGVVRLAGSFLDITVGGDGTVEAGGAASLPRLARETVKNDRGGLEWCVGIPGSVGGAVRMNAGGHGSDTAAWLQDVDIVDAVSLRQERRAVDDLDLSYRHSALQDTDVVVGARYRTIAQERGVGEQKLREITRWRREHQPGGTYNAGSVFKNPPDDSAGRIIDSLGLKGYRVGGAAVSTRHANFFVADRTATAQDVYDLVWNVRRLVAESTGVSLVPEIRFVGAFSTPASSGEPPS
jgi:UDP-N-acetylmuramate dehydrogenase